jgi:transposase
MNKREESYETYRLDHLGIVAGICEQIKLVETIDEMLPTPSGRKVSCGQATLAMVLNAMGLNGRALYLTPEYMANKPVEHLFGEGYEASDFNDDALGRGLDELHQAGVTELFAAIASNAVKEFEIEHEYVHVDTTTLSVTGQYTGEAEERGKKVNDVVKVTHGHSKAQRPDLKQVVVSLITSQQSSLPLWLEVLDGNSSDKKSFQPTVQAYCKQLAEGEEPWFIMDSACYSRETLVAWGRIRWLTRVPETSNAAKEALRCVKTEEMERLDEDYRIFPLCSIYGGVKQRWLVVYSQSAFESENKALDRQIEKA